MKFSKKDYFSKRDQIRSFGITMETFHLTETVQVLSNPSLIAQSSMNLQ